jgi:predicted metalloprotease with PDZ domain
VEGRKDEPQELCFVPPPGWRVSIALPESAGAFRAGDYDELVDSPFECGTHRVREFAVRGVPHAIALWGGGNEDLERLSRDLAKLVEAAATMFGRLPYERYLFLVHVAQGAGGGLEHRASQSVGISPWKFRPEKSYREVLSLFSHELFHAWNVKRIHPRPLGPFDYTREVHTRDLWALEGITSYYEWVILVRAGLVQPRHVFEEFVAKELKAHRDNPGSAVQSAEAASFDAWIRHYKPDANSPNVAESYYRRGSLIGLALDLLLRRETGGKASLDDVVRALFTKWGRRGVGYPEGAWEKECERFAGAKVTGFFDRHVRGLEPLPLEELLPVVGHRLVEKPEKSDDGGKERGVPKRGDLGFKTKKEEGKLVVQEVWAGRAAYDAGLDAGDELVAFDGAKADEDQITRIERDLPPGERVVMTVFRRSRLLEVPVRLGARRAFTYEVKPVPRPKPAQRKEFQAWLGVSFPKKG